MQKNFTQQNFYNEVQRGNYDFQTIPYLKTLDIISDSLRLSIIWDVVFRTTANIGGLPVIMIGNEVQIILRLSGCKHKKYVPF